ncbi:nicotinate (nicotinamide) nucleotide adenylyltransferase [Bacillus tuaregi]|uniref:nicotinate (nicotinamide) nucleotide adenylyltransferase n=1 Tax=Bacillus tuaregi TaxID=1816695 RepID=UPI0008F81AFB|nr:nicotinate (nicotinamide) nucleotide adenylyltransferase [Bacillus tuaregi]
MGRYGVFGSACDPITIGHLVTMEMVIDRRKLDGMILIPSSTKRRDKGRNLTENEHRLNMAKLAIADNPKIQVNPIEMVAEGWETYTYETMKKLKLEYPNDELLFVMGADNLQSIVRWHKGHELIESNRFIVMGREGYDMADIIAKDSFLIKNEHRFDCLSKGVNIETSSTLIRSRMKDGLSVRYLVPQPALEYALEHGLYH